MSKTSHQERLSREEAADRLQTLAQEIRSGEAAVQVGNKTVRLSPSEQVSYEIDVAEQSSFLRGSRESVEIELEWKPEE
ncbi:MULTISPECIES: amphi-Trp domain-containing protein [Halorussus]|uniref:amphi-Trp domain-containing protein n=1 Tax=Halorussus TaxID=1070314 RepID=UPI0020A152B8|nr:amphi-Trp domain-containing protein [Halorussus vallis]USZ76664.1 amphi-Trp domain-containing protein [Halorussus vallis]